MTTAQWVRAVRERSWLRQCDFGARLGLSRSTVSDWENGKRPPTDEQTRAIGEAFGEQSPRAARRLTNAQFFGGRP